MASALVSFKFKTLKNNRLLKIKVSNIAVYDASRIKLMLTSIPNVFSHILNLVIYRGKWGCQDTLTLNPWILTHVDKIKPRIQEEVRNDHRQYFPYAEMGNLSLTLSYLIFALIYGLPDRFVSARAHWSQHAQFFPYVKTVLLQCITKCHLKTTKNIF